MLNLTETAIRLYRQIFGSPEFAGQLADGIETVMDGNTAIAVTEACMTEVTTLGGGFLEQGAALAWLSEQQRVSRNLFDESLSVQYADSPRGALASAIGVCLSGHRSTVFLGAQDISTCQDLLKTAAARRIPLVIHLDNRLSANQSNSTGSGHDALHQLLDSGCFVLFAANVQEAVDFTLIARHVAELTLTPGLVVVDGLETALAVQNVCLPSTQLVETFIGRADATIDAPSIAQKQLFSEQRKRLHRWHDLDKPVLQGAMQSPQTSTLGSAARETYFDDLVADILQQGFAQFAQLTGRKYSAVSSSGLKKADIIFVAQGSAVETLSSYSHYLHSLKKTHAEKLNLGIIALHSLRPFNAQQLAEILQQKSSAKTVIVLERMSAPLADDAPLMREIRAAIHKLNAAQSGAAGINFPALRSVIYGLDGAPLKLEDLAVLCHSDLSSQTEGKYLGVPFVSNDISAATSKTKEYHPKRQVMLDTLERYYPQITELGINAKDSRLALNTQQSESTSFAVSYMLKGSETMAYALDLSASLHQFKGGFLRTAIASSWEQWAVRQSDYICQAQTPFIASSSSQINYFIVLSADEQSLQHACQQLSDKGVLIYSDSAQMATVFNEQSRQLIQAKGLTVHRVDTGSAETDEQREHSIDVSHSSQEWEKVLAALTAYLLNIAQLNLKTRKIVSLRESLIQADNEAAKTVLLECFKTALTADIDNADNFNQAAVLTSVANILEKPDKPHLNSVEVPEMVKKMGLASESYDNLPRFWDQVGVLQQAGEADQLTADPYLATGTMPSLSATFNNMTAHRQAVAGPVLPEFNPGACTACGECWSNCPDSAIAVVAMTPKALIETGIRMAGADAVRQVSAKLASRIAKRCRNNEIQADNAGELVSDAFDWLKAKSGLAEERLHAIETDFEKAHLAIADLPIVLSDELFYAQEKKQNDSGELFSLIINPDNCKACGLCVQLCDAQARASAQNADDDQAYISALTTEHTDSDSAVYQLQQQWKIWQQIPDTASATIERLLQEESLSRAAALMLSRYNAFALSGGDHGEPASGEKIAMRQLLSATEYHQQPLLYQFISELESLRNELKEEINRNLSEALPTDNMAHLAEKLADVKTRQIDLNALLEQSSQLMDTTAIDAHRTHQLVTLVLQLNELHWKLSEGTYGFGRSRYSLCITSSSIASWAGTFPYNPFHVPVTIDSSGEAAQLAAGLVRGQVNDILNAVSLMRQARAAVNSRYAKDTEKLDNLDWQDLTHEEQQLCPPLYLIGGDDLLGSHGFSQIAQLLNSAYPLKVVVFHELDGGLLSHGLAEYQLQRRSDSKNNLAMMAMSQRHAYVAQCSIADNSHLQQSVHELLSNSAAGLICIHTPSPQRHGFAPEQTLQQAQLAVASGMYPLFRYNPQHEGVFGKRLSLQQHRDEALSPVHWAIKEHRFQAHFAPLPANAPMPVELSDWLQLAAADQAKKTPYVILDEQAEKIAVSRDFALLIADQQSAWQTLQELAGIETPFTDYVEQCVEQRLSTEHQAELDALRAEYETKIVQLNADHEAQAHAKIRKQLLSLAGYDANILN